MAEQAIKPRIDRDRRLVVGIDPDLVKSGVAVARGGSLVYIDALSFPELLRFEYIERS